MKKVYLLIVLFSTTAASCTKNYYTCQCDGGLTGTGMKTQLRETSTKAATKACKSNESDPSVDGFTNCRLL